MKYTLIVLSCAAFLLGGCLEKSAPGEIPVSLYYKGKPIDPVCFATLPVASADEGVPLENCTGKSQSIATYRADQFYGMDLVNAGAGASIYYKQLGVLNGYDVVHVQYADGSGSQTSDVRMVLNKGGKLRTMSIVAAGDRCNGGVIEAKVAGDMVTYSQNVTPYGLIEASGGNEVTEFKPYEDIRSNPDNCVAKLIYKPNTTGPEAEMMVDPKSLPTAQDMKNSCFDSVYTETYSQNGAVLSVDAFKEFGRNFERKCQQFK